MRALFIGNFLAKTSGTYAISYSIGRGLSAEGISVCFASHFSNRYLRFISIISKALFYGYDIMHIDVFSNNSFLFAQVANAIARFRGKSTILTLHGGALNEFHKGRERRFNRLFASASYISTPSTFLKAYFEELEYSIAYMPNPIHLDQFSYNHSTFGRYSILWVRAFSKIYNPSLAVEVLKEVLIHFPSATLTMVGPDKGLLSEVVQLVADLNLEGKVRITGAIPNKDLSEFYQSHHVYLNTPSYESFGVALMEAASCGIPIVSNAVGEIPYLWRDGDEILLVDDKNPAKMASQVCKIFSNENLERSLSLNARRKAENFGWDRIKDQWIALFNSVTNGHSKH